MLLPEIDCPGILGPPGDHVTLVVTMALFFCFFFSNMLNCPCFSHKWKSTKNKFNLQLFWKPFVLATTHRTERRRPLLQLFTQPTQRILLKKVENPASLSAAWVQVIRDIHVGQHPIDQLSLFFTFELFFFFWLLKLFLKKFVFYSTSKLMCQLAFHFKREFNCWIKVKGKIDKTLYSPFLHELRKSLICFHQHPMLAFTPSRL